MKILRKSVAADRVGVTTSTVDRWAHEARFAHLNFPKPLRIGDGSIGWLEDEIDAWIANRAAQRDKPAA